MKYCDYCKAEKPDKHFSCEAQAEEMADKLKKMLGEDGEFMEKLKLRMNNMMEEVMGEVGAVLEGALLKVEKSYGRASAEYKVCGEMIDELRKGKFGQFWGRQN